MPGISDSLAKLIFDAYPESNIYNQSRQLGDLIIKGKIVNMVSQYYPGKPLYPNDNKDIRLQHFQSILCRIGLIDGIKSVAFSYGIGCGYAGGKWADYYNLLEEFHNAHPNITVKIYKLQ